MSTWRIDQLCKKPKLCNPILIEGLPGIGNVGKVAVDFMIDELKAKKLYEITSNTFPHSVFVNEDNLVELPKIEIFYKKFGNNRNDLLLLAGDVQPIDEESSYDFSERILDLVSSFKGREVITLGGVGLMEVPKKPKIYCTGNSKDIIKKYRSKDVKEKLYGIVGPIVGVSGLLLGLATRRKIKAVSLLAETYGHPMYLGVKGAKEILRILNEKLRLNLRIEKLEKEIKEIEKAILERKEELGEQPKGAINKFGVTYIG